MDLLNENGSFFSGVWIQSKNSMKLMLNHNIYCFIPYNIFPSYNLMFKKTWCIQETLNLLMCEDSKSDSKQKSGLRCQVLEEICNW